MAESRVSQAMVEVLGQPAFASARVSQLMVEVVHSVAVYVPPAPGGGSGRWFRDLWFEDDSIREEAIE